MNAMHLIVLFLVKREEGMAPEVDRGLTLPWLPKAGLPYRSGLTEQKQTNAL